METLARLENISKDWLTDRVVFSFSTASTTAAVELEKLKDIDLRVSAKKYRKKRSLSANAMLWACIGQIAEATNADKWSVYLQLLKLYGKFTYICCHPDAVESVKAQWRESEVWNSLDINGKPAVQMICYFGSSSYNTAEMSRLIDGTLSEMEQMGLELPMPQDIKTALEQWEQLNEKRNPE